MNRLAALRSAMSAQAIDLVCLGPGAHLEWLLGIRPHADERPLLFCATAERSGFLMPALEAAGLRPKTDAPFHEWADADGPDAALSRLLEDIGAGGARRVALDEAMRADFAALVQDRLPRARRQFAGSTVGALRMRKDDGAYRALKRNARVADRAMRAAWAAMRLGMREDEVGGAIRDAFLSQGAEPLFWIVGAGPNGAMPHHRAGERTLAERDAVVMDIGARLDGYSSDITRMAVIGAPPEGYAGLHAIVDRAVGAALAAARPGTPAKLVDKAARDVISDAGYGEHFVHRTGHGLGTEAHEPPYITSGSETILEEGMVFSIEPGIYLPGRLGIRLEEIVILRADGPEILSGLPRDAAIIDG